jgi:hypothetical protein
MDLPGSLVLTVRFRNTVTATVGCSTERTRAVLYRVEEYPAWWPTPVTWSDDGPGHLVISPLPIVRIQLDLAARSTSDVRFKYVKGPFRGTGTWVISAADGNQCEVSYAVDLRPVNPLVALVARTRRFRLKHEADIRHIIAALSERAC